MSAQAEVQRFLDGTGVVCNGPNPWDPQIHNEQFYSRVLSGGSLAVGEAYMDGWLDVEDLPDLIDRLLKAELNKKAPMDLRTLWYFVLSWLTNRQSRARAFEVFYKHYYSIHHLY